MRDSLRVNPFRQAGIHDGVKGAARFESFPEDAEITVADPVRQYNEGYAAGRSMRYVWDYKHDGRNIEIKGE